MKQIVNLVESCNSELKELTNQVTSNYKEVTGKFLSLTESNINNKQSLTHIKLFLEKVKLNNILKIKTEEAFKAKKVTKETLKKVLKEAEEDNSELDAMITDYNSQVALFRLSKDRVKTIEQDIERIKKETELLNDLETEKNDLVASNKEKHKELFNKKDSLQKLIKNKGGITTKDGNIPSAREATDSEKDSWINEK